MSGPSSQSGPARRSAAEWAVFAVSIGLIAALVAVLAGAAIVGTDGPPRFRTDVEDVRVEGEAYQVPVKVKNVGGQTAAAVSVYAEVGDGPSATRVQDTIDFLFAGEQQEVTFVFPEDPRTAGLHVGVEAYQEP